MLDQSTRIYLDQIWQLSKNATDEELRTFLKTTPRDETKISLALAYLVAKRTPGAAPVTPPNAPPSPAQVQFRAAPEGGPLMPSPARPVSTISQVPLPSTPAAMVTMHPADHHFRNFWIAVVLAVAAGVAAYYTTLLLQSHGVHVPTILELWKKLPKRT